LYGVLASGRKGKTKTKTRKLKKRNKKEKKNRVGTPLCTKAQTSDSTVHARYSTQSNLR
jgi:hypothetical protein